MYLHFSVPVHPSHITQINTDTEVYFIPTARRRVADSIFHAEKKTVYAKSTDDIFMFAQRRSHFILHINFKRSGTTKTLKGMDIANSGLPFWFQKAS